MKKQVIGVAVLACVSMPSLASNFYVLADAGKSKFEIDVGSSTGSLKENVISIGGGYKFNDNVAIELTYRDLGEIGEESIDYSDDYDFYSEKGTVSASAFQLSVLGAISLGEAATLYGRVGVADLELESKYKYNVIANGQHFSGSESDSDSKNKAVFGVGLSYSFFPSFAVRAEYSQYGEWEDLTISTTTIGLTYQF
ncbi:MAG: hypothetical protein B0W54_12655 [Cellvibrio sp. 79]|nr:MAG: hypothetical protein B0W54_12655 [Cellvibrio sp. 79]